MAIVFGMYRGGAHKYDLVNNRLDEPNDDPMQVDTAQDLESEIGPEAAIGVSRAGSRGSPWDEEASVGAR